MHTDSDVRKTHARKRSATLIYAAFIAGLCSIIYELLIATTASYFLGDSVTYFSLTIGIYMASMGVGSYLSKYMDDSLLHRFVIAELLLGFFGGISIPALYLAYAYGDAFMPAYVGFTIIIGFLIGLEIPFLTRLMEDYNELKFNIANILSFDYLGALLATISFPFLLLPVFGVYQSSLIFGLVNMSIGFVVLWVFARDIGNGANLLKGATITLTLLIAAMIFFSAHALKKWDSQLYEDRIIFSQQTPYQKIVLTKRKDDIRLFLDGNLQFSSIDEHRYHESLIHVPLSMHNTPVQRVLLLGAGDGMAVRELLKYPTINEIIVVDLDQTIIKLATENHYISALNQHSLNSDKVRIITQDAFTYLDQNSQQFDMIISDLPDPNNHNLARLYSQQFYRLLRANLAENGIFVAQSTSPYFARDAFWSIATTIKAGGFHHIYPYHAHIPSFGEWGFVIGSSQPLAPEKATLHTPTKFLTEALIPSMFSFDRDMQRTDVAVNQLDKPVLLDYYLKGWRYYAR